MFYLVDDAADYRFLIRQVFTLFFSQYSLRLFADGLELIHYMEQYSGSLPDDSTEFSPARPDLVLPGLIVLDVDMPRLNGMQTLERLKEDPLWRGVPVVMMSNRIEPEFMETASKLGASSYLVKPMDIVELKAVIEQLGHQWLA